ncbi:MAG: hypothetical protein JWM64_843 [Frankiales bacterium]|nr:hypothetical protein [Frankiales bacterium]
MDGPTRRRWEQSLLETRRDADEAFAAWRRAGGYRAPGEAASSPALFAVLCRAQERYYATAAECCPEDLDGWLRGLRDGDRGTVDEVLRWLEADYFARGTGYLKQKLLVQLCRTALTDEDRDRLRAVLLHVCDQGPRTEFRDVRRLARRQLASAGFAAELRALAASTERQTTREAALLLAAAVESAL